MKELPLYGLFIATLFVLKLTGAVTASWWFLVLMWTAPAILFIVVLLVILATAKVLTSLDSKDSVKS